jgi:D-serine deaminase-like pyridoxal phosphate-dependent protein
MRTQHEQRKTQMNEIPVRIGAPIDEIDTPALIVDLDAFERNLNSMAAFAKSAGVRLRPHAKTHKCPTVALKQIAAGAVGQCCQKVGEAEALVRGGVRDVLVSNEIVDLQKLRRLAALAADATVALCFDSTEQVDLASRAASELGIELGGLVEIEVGMQRCGIAPGQPAADLARRIADAPGLRFRGLQAYHGTAQHLPTLAERERAVGAAAEAVRATVAALRKEGLPCELVTGAGTGTYRIEAMSGLWNELQAGSYLFMDTDYARIGDGNSGGRYTDFAHSLFVLSTVISVPTPERAIVDAGLKSYSGEKGPPWVHGREDIEVTGVSDEHGRLQLGPKAERLRIGDRVMLVPGHCDPTINLHDWYVAVRRGRVESLWPITARGAMR